jgi:hypothetical protein
MRSKLVGLLVVALAAGVASAKLPAPNDEAKAKAAEAAAKSKWTDSVAAYQLCKSQDKVVAAYRAAAQKQGKPASAPVQTPPCQDPGPFAYKPPEAASKPLEASGAHSPAPTATTPPSTPTPHADAAPKK